MSGWLSVIWPNSYSLLSIPFLLPFARIPIIKGFDLSKIKFRKRRQTNGTIEIKDEFSDDFFGLEDPVDKTNAQVGLFNTDNLVCGVFNILPLGCYHQNLLELWDFKREVIQNLTVEDILYAVNNVDISATTGHKMNVANMLGDIKRNEAGEIIGAGALITQWYVHVNFSEVDHEKHGNIAGTENWVRKGYSKTN